MIAETSEGMMEKSIEQRLSYLENRLAIQDLRHTYWLSVVDRDLETMLGCYAQDAHSEFGFGFVLDGIDAFRSFYTKQFANEDLVIQVPRGTNGLITLVDEDNATGSWLIDVIIVRKSVEYGVRSGVRYHEKYKKEGGAWKISYQKTSYLYWTTQTMREGM